MRSRAVTLLTVLTVLGASSAAMAVNADTFSSGPEPIGKASTVLVPQADDSPTAAPAEDPTAEPTDEPTKNADDKKAISKVTVLPQQVAPPRQVAATPSRRPVAKAKKSAPKPPKATHGTTTTHDDSGDDHGSDDHKSDDHKSDDHESDDHESDDHGSDDHPEDDD